MRIILEIIKFYAIILFTFYIYEDFRPVFDEPGRSSRIMKVA